MPRRRWTRESVLAAIRLRRARGASVNCGPAKREDIALYSAAGYYFGGWAGALRKAGLTPEPLRREEWTKPELTAILRRLSKTHGVVTCGLIDAESKRVGGDIRSAIRVRFGSLRAARRELGLSLKREPTLWTRGLVLDKLRELAQAGPLRYCEVERTYPNLLGAVCRRFGRWSLGLEAAGVTSGTKWSRSELLRALQEAWTARDIRVDALKERLGGGIYPAAVREFGSWHSALKAAGIPGHAYNTRMASRRVLLGAKQTTLGEIKSSRRIRI